MARRPIVGFLALAALWGTAPAAIKVAVGGGAVPPLLLAAVRYDVAGAVVLAYALFGRGRLRPRTRSEWAEVSVGGLTFVAGHQAFLFTGIQYTTAAGAAVLLSLIPLFTAGLARALLPDEPTGWDLLIALALGLAGAAFVARPGPAAFESGHPGALLVLGAALSFALGSVLTRRLPSGLPRESAQAWTMLLGALALHAGSVLSGEPQAANWTLPTVVALGYLALGASALGFFLYFGLLDRLGAIGLNLVTYATPLVAAIAGWAVLGEPPTVFTAAGFGCALAAFAVLRRRELRTLVAGDRSVEG